LEIWHSSKAYNEVYAEEDSRVGLDNYEPVNGGCVKEGLRKI